MSFAVLKYMQEEIDKKTEKTVYYFLREFCDCIKESDSAYIAFFRAYRVTILKALPISSVTMQCDRITR